jgi:hypothetical protein
MEVGYVWCSDFQGFHFNVILKLGKIAAGDIHKFC